MISLRGPKPKIIAAVLAAIALAVGIYSTFFESRGFTETTGTILSLREESDADNDRTYYPTVEYTVDGVTYTGELRIGSGSYKVGKTITVRYNPEDPTDVHGGLGLGIYFMVLGAGMLAVIVFITVREKQRQKETKEAREMTGKMAYAPSVQGEERELYFLTDTGTAKYGHRIEDGSRRVLYEAKMTKFTMLQPYGFDFIDHEHGTTVPHLVGHDVESDWGNSLFLDNNYTFELDGVDIWKHLRENGVSVESAYTAGETTVVGQRYRILRNGEEIANVLTTSQYVHEEDAEQHKVAGAIPNQGFYRIWTREQYLDVIFVTLVAFARSGASDDRGGNFGAIVGTVKNLGK